MLKTGMRVYCKGLGYGTIALDPNRKFRTYVTWDKYRPERWFYCKRDAEDHVATGHWSTNAFEESEMTQETKKHPHDAVIRAWLDGKTVQVLAGDGKWHSVTHLACESEMPYWNPRLQFRIKPEDPDVYVSIAAYTTYDNTQLAAISRNSSNTPGTLPRLKMKLSEYLKIAQILD